MCGSGVWVGRGGGGGEVIATKCGQGAGHIVQ